MCEATNTTVKPGDYLIIQRQNYTKLHKIKQHGTMSLGRFTVEMDKAIGCNYSDTFQMRAKPDDKRVHELVKVSEINTVAQLNIEKSGEDNRNITDDGSAQNLTKEQIETLKEDDLSSSTIVERLMANSKTFASKTEYSQQKYLKKKEKKYFEYIQIRKPTIRLLAQLLHRQDPGKTLGVRVDDLSQILTAANVQSDGNYLLYDSGTSGLMSAALMNALGAKTAGSLIHLHPGNECQKNAFLAMQFPEEQSERCINVNLYSVLRNFHQNTKQDEEVPVKKIKLEGDAKKRWQLDDERACGVLRRKVDSLIVVAKEHPLSIIKELVDFLKSGRSVVVYSILREPLQEVYVYLKTRQDFINVRLTGSFMRFYQVLPERTHPDVNMTTGGFILSGLKLSP